MKTRIMTMLAVVLAAFIISLGIGQLYSRNETFRKGYVNYANGIETRLHAAMDKIGLHAPKLVFVE